MELGKFAGGGGGSSRRPYLEAFLMIPGLAIEGNISFVVDTGADSTCLSPSDAQRLNVDYAQLKHGSTCGGIGGIVQVFAEPAVAVFASDSHLYVYEFQLDILTPDSCGMEVPSILGRDILDRWCMTYDPSNEFLGFDVRSADHVIPIEPEHA